MNYKNGLKFLLAVALIAVVSLATAFGVKIGSLNVKPVQDYIKLGLDFKGGVYATLVAQGKVDSDTINRAIAVIRNRVDMLGVTEPVITPLGSNAIMVQLPGIKDPEAAIKTLGQTAQLRFVGPDGKTILTGAEVKTSKAEMQVTSTGVEEPVVTLSFNVKGTKLFSDATQKFLGKPIAIYLDNKMISNPVVQAHITDGNAVITGSKSFDEASKLATLIRSGALPVPLKAEEVRAIGPTLGMDSMRESLMAGLYGIIIVMLFMIAYYRLPGFIADLALIIYTVITLIILALIHATLTLPGMAGIILSIGMAVDANIIIFERVKEELRNGKSLRSAIDAGFAKAFWTVFDANLTTIIAGIVLFYLGSGTIKGFAVTLVIGVLVSMFTAITLTRLLLKMLVNVNITNNLKLYGA
ncbi:protein translocase subunit SecD [Caldanaerobius polysaccharolyticus]|uniref:protein translocase subunit SecD n=1 Tax=Caldanaerobius polysaccharolyticus TaxID=44256 RepID=UPI000478DC82|nr:protein translocase subunit SecD [Caldanaerobius polysaccharolyticus]